MQNTNAVGTGQVVAARRTAMHVARKTHTAHTRGGQYWVDWGTPLDTRQAGRQAFSVSLPAIDHGAACGTVRCVDGAPVLSSAR
mmetsp:Transcript_43254/g.108073  ORF Transcript_43254/g.108073 Transcript_43254/m.108073 type:complete len:84 (+) Transcript_43254:164-415(+)